MADPAAQPQAKAAFAFFQQLESSATSSASALRSTRRPSSSPAASPPATPGPGTLTPSLHSSACERSTPAPGSRDDGEGKLPPPPWASLRRLGPRHMQDGQAGPGRAGAAAEADARPEWMRVRMARAAPVAADPGPGIGVETVNAGTPPGFSEGSVQAGAMVDAPAAVVDAISFAAEDPGPSAAKAGEEGVHKSTLPSPGEGPGPTGTAADAPATSAADRNPRDAPREAEQCLNPATTRSHGEALVPTTAAAGTPAARARAEEGAGKPRTGSGQGAASELSAGGAGAQCVVGDGRKAEAAGGALEAGLLPAPHAEPAAPARAASAIGEAGPGVAPQPATLGPDFTSKPAASAPASMPGVGLGGNPNTSHGSGPEGDPEMQHMELWGRPGSHGKGCEAGPAAAALCPGHGILGQAAPAVASCDGAAAAAGESAAGADPASQPAAGSGKSGPAALFEEAPHAAADGASQSASADVAKRSARAGRPPEAALESASFGASLQEGQQEGLGSAAHAPGSVNPGSGREYIHDPSPSLDPKKHRQGEEQVVEALGVSADQGNGVSPSPGINRVPNPDDHLNGSPAIAGQGGAAMSAPVAAQLEAAGGAGAGEGRRGILEGDGGDLGDFMSNAGEGGWAQPEALTGTDATEGVRRGIETGGGGVGDFAGNAGHSEEMTPPAGGGFGDFGDDEDDGFADFEEAEAPFDALEAAGAATSPQAPDPSPEPTAPTAASEARSVIGGGGHVAAPTAPPTPPDLLALSEADFLSAVRMTREAKKPFLAISNKCATDR